MGVRRREWARLGERSSGLGREPGIGETPPEWGGGYGEGRKGAPGWGGNPHWEGAWQCQRSWDLG